MRRLFVMSYGTSIWHVIGLLATATRRVAREPRSPQDCAVGDTGDWRSRRWEATHRRIYQAAMRLFQEQGFERVSIGQLAAAAEVSVPTFYAHFPSKEHVVMQLPTAEQMEELIAGQPGDLPVATRVRLAATAWLAQWGPAEREDLLARWRIIAATPELRVRAAQFERTTAGLLADAMPTGPSGSLTPTDAVVVNAHLAAFTSAVLVWADSEGTKDLDELIDAAFETLQRGMTG
jgi:AcrR family transcriptional regulator